MNAYHANKEAYLSANNEFVVLWAHSVHLQRVRWAAGRASHQASTPGTRTRCYPRDLVGIQQHPTFTTDVIMPVCVRAMQRKAQTFMPHNGQPGGPRDWKLSLDLYNLCLHIRTHQVWKDAVEEDYEHKAFHSESPPYNV